LYNRLYNQRSPKIFKPILEYRLTNSKNITTFKNDITPFVYIFKNLGNDNKHSNNQYKIYKSLESDLNFRLGSTEADNIMKNSDNENHVQKSSLLQVQASLKQNMDDLFLKIGTDNIKYKRVHMQYLSLSLAILSPTLRLEYMKMRITDK